MEFIITYACSGSCKHCSQGDHSPNGEALNVSAAVDALRKVTNKFNISSVMTFGGEPLLYADRVYRIHSAAAELGIEKRQLITNGFFSRDVEYIKECASRLAESKVNDLLLSADAFHQENIPLEYVKCFAKAALDNKIPVRLNPAWLNLPVSNNPYNIRTRQIIEEFKAMGIPEGCGNIVFPKGNALKYLAQYIDADIKDPYEEDPNHITSISIEPDGALLNSNILQKDIMEIISEYKSVNEGE